MSLTSFFPSSSSSSSSSSLLSLSLSLARWSPKSREWKKKKGKRKSTNTAVRGVHHSSDVTTSSSLFVLGVQKNCLLTFSVWSRLPRMEFFCNRNYRQSIISEPILKTFGRGTDGKTDGRTDGRKWTLIEMPSWRKKEGRKKGLTIIDAQVTYHILQLH